MTLAFPSRFSDRVAHYIHTAEGNDVKLAARFEVLVSTVHWWARSIRHPHRGLQFQVVAWIDEQTRNT